MPSPGEWIGARRELGDYLLSDAQINAMLDKILLDSPPLSVTIDNKTKNTLMKLDKSERYLIPSMQGPRPISLYSLRPGDWLYAAPATGKKGYDLMVVQNSNVLKRIELLWPSGNMEVAEYEHIILTGEGMHYLGHGHKRLWRNRLPRFIRRFFNVYSKPQSK